MKHILFFVAENGFKDEELFEPKQILEEAGHVCDIISTNAELAQGSDGAMVMPTVSLDSVTVVDYDAIVLIGGPGALEMGTDFMIQDIIMQASQKPEMLLCAICIAPQILAKLGLLKGKKATIYPTGVEALKNAECEYIHEAVVIDDRIITADGPQSAVEFGNTILDVLEN